MKNTIKQILPKLILLLILLNFSNKSWAQANCLNNDTLYFDNQVDGPICLSIECANTISSLGMPPIELIDSIENHLPLMSLARNCPNPRCNNSYRGYVSCGGPTGPQLGKIILKPNSGLNCQNLKISLVRVWNSSPFPSQSVFTAGGPTTVTYNNCAGCTTGGGPTPNLEMTLDCNSKTLYLKCVQ
jgi:hypothetical protein